MLSNLGYMGRYFDLPFHNFDQVTFNLWLSVFTPLYWGNIGEIELANTLGIGDGQPKKRWVL